MSKLYGEDTAGRPGDRSAKRTCLPNDNRLQRRRGAGRARLLNPTAERKVAMWVIWSQGEVVIVAGAAT
jgi:hypothetical protein